MMTYSKLKLLMLLTIALTLLFAPVLLEMTSNGTAHAMGFLGKKPGDSRSSDRWIAISKPDKEPDPDPERNPEGPGQEPLPINNAPAPVPEPTTLILVGGGALGLAAFRKKLKKNKKA